MALNKRICKLNSQLDSILVKQGYIQFSATSEQVHSLYSNVYPVKANKGSSSDLFSQKYFGRISGFICFNLTGFRIQLYVYNKYKGSINNLSDDVYDGFTCLSSRREIEEFVIECNELYSPRIEGKKSNIMINVSSYSDTSILFSLDNGKSIVFSTPPPHD